MMDDVTSSPYDGVHSQSERSNAHRSADSISAPPPEPCVDNCAMSESGHFGKPVGVLPSFDSNERHPNPLWYCKLITRRPLLIFVMTLLGNLSMIALTGIMMATGYDILPTNFGRVPLDLDTDVMFLRSRAWLQRDDHPDILPKIKTNSRIAERSVRTETIQIIFESENVFTKENLNSIYEIENELTSIPEYSEFCLSFRRFGCTKPDSVIRFFDGTYVHLQNNSLFYDPNFENISLVLAAANQDRKLSQMLAVFLAADSVINDQLTTSRITRVMLHIGKPLNGFAHLEDDSTKQEELIKRFVIDEIKPKLEQYAKQGVGQMESMYYSVILFIDTINSQVLRDLSLALGSFVFIFGFMLCQTQSIFITGFGILSIFTSFAGANLIYRIAFDFRYFGVFNVLSVFIILGIGADDIFVFYDTWRATSHNEYPSLAHRLSDCYRRAAKAMLVTSLTTMIAFIANAFSPLLAISSFGLFSGILVFVNYISVVIFFPSVVVLHQCKFSNWTWWCVRPCIKQRVRPDNTNAPKKSLIVRFFAGPYYRFVTHGFGRWIILCVFAVGVSLSIYQASNIRPNEKEIQFFREGHNMAKAPDRINSAFKPSSRDRTYSVSFIWGIKTLDRSGCHKTDFHCPGSTVWDDGFDLNQEDSQIALLELCNKTRHLSTDAEQRMHIKRDSLTGLLEVNCFMERMDAYLRNEINNSVDSEETNLRNAISQIMIANPDLYNTATIPSDFDRYFEVGVAYWLTNGYSPGQSHDFMRFSQFLGEANGTSTLIPVTGKPGYYIGTRLRYAAITVNTTLKRGTLGFVEGLDIMDSWESFFNDQLKAMPASLANGFQVTVDHGDLWHYLKVQQVLVQSALRGILIGICLAFPILVLATQNIIIGFLATVSIALVTVTVVGIIPTAGWKLGVLESLNLSLVVGLAVDYVVHLAEGYHLSKNLDRLGRVHDMLKEVGISVLSGAITTMGASIFMLFAQILFFMQFGIFMFCTILFSLLYSLVLFSTLLAIIGPQDNVGSIKPVFRAIRKRFRCRKKSTKCYNRDDIGPNSDVERKDLPSSNAEVYTNAVMENNT